MIDNRIFNLFVGTEELMKDWMKRPFVNNDGNVWATDGKAALIVSPDVTDITGPKDSHPVKMPAILDGKDWMHFAYDEIGKAVEKCGKDEVMEEYECECPECGGDGEVEWGYEADTVREIYYKDFECPVCEGTGTIYKELGSGKFEPSRKNCVKIGAGFYSAHQMSRILRMMEMIGIWSLDVVSKPKRDSAVIFQFGTPDVRVMQMPVYLDENDKNNVIVTIKPTN